MTTIYKPKLLFLTVFVLLISQPVNAILVKFEFGGEIAVTSGIYTAGESFEGFYIMDSETVGVRHIDISSSGDRITSYKYFNAVVDFKMNFADKTIWFDPDGISDSYGYDSTIQIQNDQRYTMSSGGYYYSDRFIATFNDAVASNGFVDFVQFDWNESSFTGYPDLLTSEDLPLEPTDYTVTSYQGRIAADGDLNIHFTLNSLEVVPVPGDINDDGILNLIDVISSLQACSGLNPDTTIVIGADVNNDNRIGMAEAIYSLQKFSGLR